MINYKSLLYSVLLIGIVSCYEQNNSKISAKELAESRKIMKISGVDILVMGEELGMTIINLLEKRIETLEDSIIVQSCGQEKVNALDSLLSKFNSKVVRLNSRSTGVNKEKQELIKSYQYSYASGKGISKSIQKIDDKNLLFLSPIDSTDRLFLLCSMTSDSGKSIFPGLWSVTIPIKEVVLRMK